MEAAAVLSRDWKLSAIGAKERAASKSSEFFESSICYHACYSQVIDCCNSAGGGRRQLYTGSNRLTDGMGEAMESKQSQRQEFPHSYGSSRIGITMLLLAAVLVTSSSAIGQNIESLMKGPGGGRTQPAKGATGNLSAAPVPKVSIELSSWNGKALPLFFSSAGASSAVESALSMADMLIPGVAGHLEDVPKKEAEYKKANAEYMKLIDGKGAFMSEIRSGLFCSGCGRTKSDIESRGEHFPHSGQHVVPATPEQIAQFEREYNAKIERARQQSVSAQKQFEDAQKSCDEAVNALTMQLALIVDGLRQEGPLLISELQKRSCPLQAKLKYWREKIKVTPPASLTYKTLESNLESAPDQIEGYEQEYTDQRAKMFGQMSRNFAVRSKAQAVIGAAAMPPNQYDRNLVSMPTSAGVSCP